MKITRRSPLTGNLNTLDIDVTEAQVSAYMAGTLLQDAFPDLTADEREFIHTGITPDEWHKAFPEEDGA